MTKRLIWTREHETHFLNVDLDIISKTPLDSIVEAFGEQVFVLHAGKRGRRYSAHFELHGYGQPADRVIGGLVDLVKRLPRAARRLWNQADVREFNIGIEAAAKAPVFELRLRPETLTAVAGVNGRLVITVYAPQRLPRPASRKRASTRRRG